MHDNAHWQHDTPIGPFLLDGQPASGEALVDEVARRPMDVEERVRFWAHVEWMEVSYARQSTVAAMTGWLLLVLGSALVLAVVVLFGTGSLRTVAWFGVWLVSIVSVLPVLVAGRPLGVPPTTPLGALPWAERRQRLALGIWWSAWGFVAVQGLVLGVGLWQAAR